MKIKTLASLIFSHFFIFSYLSLLVLAQLKPGNSNTPFGFIKDLEGTEKGQQIPGIGDLKVYLKRFGFLEQKAEAAGEKPNTFESSLMSTDGDDFKEKHNLFDNRTEAAIRAFQKYYHLEETGTLSTETVSTMIKPRCAMPDKGFIAESANSGNATGPGPDRFRFFPGNPKWQPSKYNLTYAYLEGTSARLMYAVRDSFRAWERVSPFRFQHSDDYLNADLKISFETGDHGDNNPFDGPGGVYAHAFAPPVGVIHFDMEERWFFRSQENTVDLFTISLHEIGHSLGLDHTPAKESIMYPYIAYGEIKNLHENDIQGIRTLYNLTNETAPPPKAFSLSLEP